MPTYEISTERLRECWIARPAGELGTCGWHPFSWTIGVGDTEAAAKADFKIENWRAIAAYLGDRENV